MRLPAYILAGGKSTRFGSDKARARVDGLTLLEHAVASVAGAASSITVVAASHGAYDDLGYRTIGDLEPDLGPLGGLHAALLDAVAVDRREHWVLVTACDWVGLRPEWVDALLDALRHAVHPPETRAGGRGPSPLAVAFRAERWEPLPALFHVALAHAIAERLRTGRRALWQLLDDVPACGVARPREWMRARQMNRPDA